MSCVRYSDLATLLSKNKDDGLPPRSGIPSTGQVVRTMREFPESKADAGLGYNVMQLNDTNRTLCISNIGHPGAAPPCGLAQFIAHMHPSPPIPASPPMPLHASVTPTSLPLHPSPPMYSSATHPSQPKKFECKCNLITDGI